MVIKLKEKFYEDKEMNLVICYLSTKQHEGVKEKILKKFCR